MKITIEGLTLGAIASLESKGYEVIRDDDEQYVNINKAEQKEAWMMDAAAAGESHE